MAIISQTDKYGKTHQFQIAGNVPSETESARVQSYMNRANGVSAPEEAPKAGLIQSGKAGIQGLQSDFYGGLETIGQSAGSDWLQEIGRAGRERNAAEQQAILPDEQRADPGFNAAYAKQAVGETAPYMGLGLAGGFAGQAIGGAIGTALLPGPGTVAGGLAGRGIGALLGSAASYFLPQTGSAASRQRDAYGTVINPESAMAAGALTSLTEAVMDKFLLLGRSKLLSAAASKGIQIPEKVVKSKVANILADTAAGGGIEAAQEVSQAMIERISAGLPLDDEEAMYEYKVAGLTAAGIGGVMGGGAGVIKHGLYGRKDRKNAKIDKAINEDIAKRTDKFREFAQPESLRIENQAAAFAPDSNEVRGPDDPMKEGIDIVDHSRSATNKKYALEIFGSKGPSVGEYSWQNDSGKLVNPDGKYTTRAEAEYAARQDLATLKEEERQRTEASEIISKQLNLGEINTPRRAFGREDAKFKKLEDVQEALKKNPTTFRDENGNVVKVKPSDISKSKIKALHEKALPNIKPEVRDNTDPRLLALEYLSKLEQNNIDWRINEAQKALEKYRTGNKALNDSTKQLIDTAGEAGVPESKLIDILKNNKTQNLTQQTNDARKEIKNLLDAGVIVPATPVSQDGSETNYKLSLNKSYRRMFQITEQEDTKGRNNFVVTSPNGDVNQDINQVGGIPEELNKREITPESQGGGPTVTPQEKYETDRIRASAPIRAFSTRQEAEDFIKEELGRVTTKERIDREKKLEAERQAKNYDTIENTNLRAQKLGINSVRQQFRRILDQMGLPDAALKLEAAYDKHNSGRTIEGSYEHDTITIFWDIYQKGISEGEIKAELAKVMNHEVIHAVRQFLKPNEWKDLTNHAAKKKRVVDGVVRPYTYLQWVTKTNSNEQGVLRDGMTKTQLEEEAVAEMFRDWNDKPAAITGRPASLLNKIVKLFKALFRMADDDRMNQIFREILSGKVASRTAADGVEGRSELRQTLYNAINNYGKLDKELKDKKAEFETFKSTSLEDARSGKYGRETIPGPDGTTINKQIDEITKQYETDIATLTEQVDNANAAKNAAQVAQTTYIQDERIKEIKEKYSGAKLSSMPLTINKAAIRLGDGTIIESPGKDIGTHFNAIVKLSETRDDLVNDNGEIDFGAIDPEEGFTLSDGSWATRQEAATIVRQTDEKLYQRLRKEIGIVGETIEDDEITSEGISKFQDRQRAADELRNRVARAAADGQNPRRVLLHASNVNSKAGNAGDIDPDILEKIKQDDIAAQLEMKEARSKVNQAIEENNREIIRFSSMPIENGRGKPDESDMRDFMGNQRSRTAEDMAAASVEEPNNAQRENAQHAATINALSDHIENYIRNIAYNFTEEQKAAEIALKIRNGLHASLTWTQERFQDQYAHVGQFMYDVMKSGGIIVEGNDPRRLLTLFRSKAGEAINARKDKGGLYWVASTLVNAVKNDKSQVEPLAKLIKAVDEFVKANEPGPNGPARAAYTILGTIKQKAGTSGMSYGAILTELYAIAKHAPHRNAMVRGRQVWSVNGTEYLDKNTAREEASAKNTTAQPVEERTVGEKGSGLTDAEAAQIVSYIESLPNFNEISKAYEAMRDIIRDTNRVRRAQGLVPTFFDDGMDNFYVPLRGHADPYLEGLDLEGEQLLNEYMPRVGKGLQTRGPEDKAVLGRTTMPTDILYTIMVQNSETIVRGAKNEIGMSLARMIRQNWKLFGKLITSTDNFGNEFQMVVGDYDKGGLGDNSPAVEIDPKSEKHFIDKIVYVMENGKRVPKKKRVVDNQWKNRAGEGEYLFEFKENGQSRLIRFNDKRVAQSLTRSSGEMGNNWFLKGAATVNHYLSMANITYNPEFILPNFIRDTMTAAININQFEMPDLTKDVLSNIKSTSKALRQLYRELPPTAETEEAHKFIKEMNDFGGITSFAGLRDLNTVMKDALAWNATNLGSPDADIAGNLAQKGAYKFTKMMEDYNRVAENTTRAAVFMALRKRGFSAQKAADASKRMTVDFNAGGTWKPAFNSLYLFYNASVQGSAAILGGFAKSKKVQKIVYSIAAGGAMSDFINSLISPIDDDGEPIYDKIPDYVLEHNIIMLDFFGVTDRGYFAIPLPYGYNAVWNAGRHGMKSMMGRETVAEASFGLVSGLVNAYNPFGGMNSLLNFVAPTAMDPFVDLSLNSDFASRPIYKEESPFGADVPDSQLYWNSTSGLAKGVAELLADPLGVTGLRDPKGNEIPGMIEVHPDSIEYGWDALTGGLGKFIRRMYDLGDKAVTPGGFDDFSTNTIPIFRRFYGNITTRNDLTSYVEKRDWALTLLKEEKSAIDNGEFERLRYVRQNYKEDLKIARKVKALNSQRVALQRQIRKIVNNTRIPQAERDKRIKRLRERQDEIVLKANTMMNKEKFDKPALMNVI